MDETITACTPQFTEYVHHFCQLRSLVARGDDESPEAECLRDDMDVLWNRMTTSDLDRLDGLALDLSHVGVDRDPPAAVPDALENEFQQARVADDVDGALRFLRVNEFRLPPHDVAALRGILWSELGQHAPAAVFMGDAIRLKPNDVRLRALYFRFLLRAGEVERARTEVLQMVDAESGPYTLLLAADVLFDCSASDGLEDTSCLRQIVELASRGLDHLDRAPQQAYESAIVAAALFSKALSHELLGERFAAFDAANQGEHIASHALGGTSSAPTGITTDDTAEFRRRIQDRRDRYHRAICDPHSIPCHAA